MPLKKPKVTLKSKTKFTPAQNQSMQRMLNKAKIGAIKRTIEFKLDHKSDLEHALSHVSRAGQVEIVKVKRGRTLDGRPAMSIPKKAFNEIANKRGMLLHTHPSLNRRSLCVNPSVTDVTSFIKSPLKKEAIVVMDKDKVAATIVLRKRKEIQNLSPKQKGYLSLKLDIHLGKMARLNKFDEVGPREGMQYEGFDRQEAREEQAELNHLVRTTGLKDFHLQVRIFPSKGYFIRQDKYGDLEAVKKS